MSHPVRAAQLVYSNVEEHLSPTRRRGFQLWLRAESLDARVQDEVEARVNSFVRPAGLPPDVRRLVFAPLAATPLAATPLVLLARLVPIQQTDKFGRGGRFHAHCLILPAREFAAACGNHPFAVFDGGFAFQTDPQAVPPDVWKGGKLPDVDVPTTTPRAVDPAKLGAELGEVLPAAVAWVAGGADEAVLALPVPPERAEEFARAVLAALPPSLRTKATFDTLWPGKGKFPYRLAGAGTPAAVQGWTFRQFARFDPIRGNVVPPLAAAGWADDLGRWWAKTPDLTTADRESSLALARWLDAADGRPPEATPAAIERVGRLAASGPRWEVLIAATVAEALSPELAELPGVTEAGARHFGEWSAEGFARVRQGATTDAAAGWVLAAVEARPTLTEADAHRIRNWPDLPASSTGERLKLLAERWIPGRIRKPVEVIRHQKGSEHEWLRGYAANTLPPEHQTLDGVVGLVARLTAGGTEADFDTADLFEAVHGWQDGTAAARHLNRLRFLLKCGGRLGGNPNELLAFDPDLAAWAGGLLQRCAGWAEPVALSVDDVPADLWLPLFPPHGGFAHGHMLLGVRVIPPDGGGDGLLRVLAAADPRQAVAAVLPAAHPDRYPVRERSEFAVGPTVSGWKECEAAYTDKNADKLAARLRKGTDELFAEVANDHLFAHADGRFTVGHLPDGRTLFAGAAVSEFNPGEGGRTLALLRGLAASVVEVRRVDDDRPPPPPDPLHLRRLLWLVMRLLHPAATRHHAVA